MNSSLQRQDITNCLGDTKISFEEKSLLLYEYQKNHNAIYRQFLKYLGQEHVIPRSIEEIPFLPIYLFKSNRIQTGTWQAEQVFMSSGTTQAQRSHHYVRSLADYHLNTKLIWEDHFGPLDEYRFLSLLPNYHKNSNSSLLSMVSYFMKHSYDQKEKYFLHDYSQLFDEIEKVKCLKTKVVLFGVSFALLEYCENFRHEELGQFLIVETGGMKKYKKSITRSDLHQRLNDCFQGAAIYSEYGMSECLSQIYTSHGSSSEFVCNEKMRILISDPTDPFNFLLQGRSGRVNIIDLANIDSIAFIATDDIGKVTERNRVEIMGRLSNSELRGCNYLI